MLLGDQPSGNIIRLWERRLIIGHWASRLSTGHIFAGTNGDAELILGAILSAGDTDGNEYIYRGSPRIGSGARCLYCGCVQQPKYDALKMATCVSCGRWNAMYIPTEYYNVHNTAEMIARQLAADLQADQAATEAEATK
jgi:hypothetical protein